MNGIPPKIIHSMWVEEGRIVCQRTPAAGGDCVSFAIPPSQSHNVPVEEPQAQMIPDILIDTSAHKASYNAQVTFGGDLITMR